MPIDRSLKGVVTQANTRLYPQYRGEWQPVPYEVADVVRYNNALYVADSNTSNSEIPGINNVWKVVISDGGLLDDVEDFITSKQVEINAALGGVLDQKTEWNTVQKPAIEQALNRSTQQYQQTQAGMESITQQQALNNAQAAAAGNKTPAVSVAAIPATLGLYYITGQAEAGQVWERLAVAENGSTLKRRPELEAVGRKAAERYGVQPEDYGAVGDGVTDDTAAWQAAATYASTNRLPLLPRAGTYLIGTVSAPHLHVRGAPGIGTTLKAKAGLPAGAGLLSSANGLLREVKIDGNNTCDRLIQNSGVFDIERCTLTNVRAVAGTASRLIMHPNTATSLRVKNCTLSNVTPLENGTEGDTDGSDIGIYIATGGFVIEDNTFLNIGGYEDGDCIRVQLAADAADVWASAGKDSRITGNKFPEIKKRAVKCQASDVEIRGNTITSTATDATLCPYAGVEIFGRRNTVNGNSINLARAVACVALSQGGGNTVRENTLTLTSTNTTARANASRLIMDLSGGNNVRDNTLDCTAVISSITLTSVTGTTIQGNRWKNPTYTAVSIIGGGSHTITGNYVHGVDATVKFTDAVIMQDSTNNRIEANSFQYATNAVRYIGTSSGNTNRNNTFGAGVTNRVHWASATTPELNTNIDVGVAVTLTPPQIAAGAAWTTSVTLTGAAPGKPVSIVTNVTGTPEAGLLILPPICTANNTVQVTFMNASGAAMTPASRSYNVKLI